LRWCKNVGDTVARMSRWWELETDKVTVEIAAPAARHLGGNPQAGRCRVNPDEVLARLRTGGDERHRRTNPHCRRPMYPDHRRRQRSAIKSTFESRRQESLQEHCPAAADHQGTGRERAHHRAGCDAPRRRAGRPQAGAHRPAQDFARRRMRTRIAHTGHSPAASCRSTWSAVSPMRRTSPRCSRRDLYSRARPTGAAARGRLSVFAGSAPDADGLPSSAPAPAPTALHRDVNAHVPCRRPR